MVGTWTRSRVAQKGGVPSVSVLVVACGLGCMVQCVIYRGSRGSLPLLPCSFVPEGAQELRLREFHELMPDTGLSSIPGKPPECSQVHHAGHATRDRRALPLPALVSTPGRRLETHVATAAPAARTARDARLAETIRAHVL